MNSLPNYLQKDIEEFLASAVLQGLDLFQSLPTNIIGKIALKLKSKSCNVGQKLFEYGDLGNELFIQRTGSSKLYINNTGKYRKLKRGDVCGENVILSRKRLNTLQCVTWSEFYTLDITDIIDVFNQNYHPKTAKKVWKKIKSFLRKSATMKCMATPPAQESDMGNNMGNNTIGKASRHVNFRSFYFKDRFASYVESAVCYDKSVVPDESFFVNKDAYNKDEASLHIQDEVEQFKQYKNERKKKPSFHSIQQMFFKLKSGVGQRSNTRDESIEKHNKIHTNTGTKPLVIGLEQYGGYGAINANGNGQNNGLDDDDSYSNDEFTEERSAGFGEQIGVNISFEENPSD